MKRIKENEEFEMDGNIFCWFKDGPGIKLKRIREAWSKSEPKKLTPPTFDEVKSFFKEKGYNEQLAKTFFDGYENGEPPWHDSRGNPVRSWKQKAIQVWFKDDNKSQSTTPKMVR